MAYVTLLLNRAITFIIMIYYVDKAHTLELMGNNLFVDQYHIELKLHPNDNFLIRCNIHVKIFNEMTLISMFKDDHLVYKQATIVNKEQNITQKASHSNKTFEENTKVELYFERELLPGSYILHVTFESFNLSAFQQVYSDFRQGKNEVVWLSSSCIQPIWIQRIIPCWIESKEDIPLLNMPTFNFSILHMEHHSVITNMDIREEKLDEEEYEEEFYPKMKWTYFDTTPRMSPYGLSIIVTSFTRTVIHEDTFVNMWCKNQSANSLQFALTVVRRITTFLKWKKEWHHYRFPTRVKLIVIPNLRNSLEPNFRERNDSLVHPGIIIANEADITYDEENDTVGRKHNVMRLLGYEVMREYYEWVVNSYWEPSTWLSKGFATFVATHILTLAFPSWRMTDLFVVQIQHECLSFDVDNGMSQPSPQQNKIIPIEIIDNMKASVILRMLQHAFISEAFWKAIETFTYESKLHNNKERHLEIFWRALKDAHDEINSSYNIENLMHPWIEEKGYFVLTVKRNYYTHTSTMDLLLYKGFNFWKKNQTIPMSYTTRTNFDFNQTIPRNWFNFFLGHYMLDLNYRENSWVIFNIQQTGYYRVNYDDENWASISTYLNDDDYWKIHVLNRAQLIDDAFHFMLLGKLKAVIFWQLTKYLERETDYIAWYPMFKAVEYMSTSFQLYKELHLIKSKFSRMLNMLLWNIKYVEQPTDDDFTKALRQEAAQWACSLKMPYCLESALFRLKQHFENETKLSPWWKKWAYCYGLMEVNNITWYQTLNKIKGNDNDKLLYLVTCPNHLVKINYYTSIYEDIKLHITSNTKVQFELRHFVHTIVKSLKNDEKYNDENDDKTYKDNETYKNLLNNFANIKPRQLQLSAAVVILFNNIYSEHLLYEVCVHIMYLKASDVFKDISKSHLVQKATARRVQIRNRHRLFERINPQN